MGTVIEGQLHVAGSIRLEHGGSDVAALLRTLLQSRGKAPPPSPALHRFLDGVARLPDPEAEGKARVSHGRRFGAQPVSAYAAGMLWSGLYTSQLY